VRKNVWSSLIGDPSRACQAFCLIRNPGSILAEKFCYLTSLIRGYRTSDEPCDGRVNFSEAGGAALDEGKQREVLLKCFGNTCSN